MTEGAHYAATGIAFRSWQHRPRWAGYAAAVWSPIQGALGPWRALGGQPHGVSADQGALASLGPLCPSIRVEEWRPGANNHPQADCARKGNA